MRAIITGATGAVGMALISELISRDFDILVLLREGSKRGDRIPAHTRIKRIFCSLDRLSEFCGDGEKYDVFFHLAWEGTSGSARDDMRLQISNIRHTVDAASLAARLGCSVFVGAGSQAEYGRVFAALNSRTPAFPESGYGMAKLCAGQMSRGVCRGLGIRHVWARILSVYGPHDNENSLIPTVIKKLLCGEHVALTAGEQTWDYIYSKDAARALVALALEGRDGGAYCIGGGKARPLREYIEVIRDMIDAGAQLGFGDIPYAEGQVMYLKADIDELVRDTGYAPLTSFEEGIAQTISFYRGCE